MLRGTLSGDRRGQDYKPGGGFARVHKEGGKVQLKPLPVKLQMGSRLSVAVDVAGAIAGLVPGGSIAGAVAGIGVSTPLYMSAAKERKGHLDASD